MSLNLAQDRHVAGSDRVEGCDQYSLTCEAGRGVLCGGVKASDDGWPSPLGEGDRGPMIRVGKRAAPLKAGLWARAGGGHERFLQKALRPGQGTVVQMDSGSKAHTGRGRAGRDNRGRDTRAGLGRAHHGQAPRHAHQDRRRAQAHHEQAGYRRHPLSRWARQISSMSRTRRRRCGPRAYSSATTSFPRAPIPGPSSTCRAGR